MAVESTKGALSIETAYRSPLEEKVADQLTGAGVGFEYERGWLECIIPARKAKYKPDFTTGPIIIEAKGRFGHDQGDKQGAEVRQKMILIKEQNPLYDIRIVFQNAKLKIRKGSKTTYAEWADDHGFKWSDKGIVPKAWLEEIKAQQKGKSNDNRNGTASQAKCAKGSGASRKSR